MYFKNIFFSKLKKDMGSQPLNSCVDLIIYNLSGISETNGVLMVARGLYVLPGKETFCITKLFKHKLYS